MCCYPTLKEVNSKLNVNKILILSFSSRLIWISINTSAPYVFDICTFVCYF